MIPPVAQYLIAFLFSFLFVLCLTPLFAKLSDKHDFTDKPTERKIHQTPLPLCGGLVMFLGFSAGFIFLVAKLDWHLYVVLLGGAMLLIIGLVDDVYKIHGKEFRVLPRVAVYLAAASLAFAADIRFTGFLNPFTDKFITFALPLQYVFSVLWIIGIVTVINFLDGLDGLAGGLTLLSGITFFIFSLLKGQVDSAVMSLLLVGAVCGFLRYNAPPARVIMGDSGAYVLGYFLAVISLHGMFKQATVITMLVPILAMGVPIFDSLLVVIRRLLARKPAHVADSKDITHIHYRLVRSGMQPRHATMLIVLLSACLNLISIIIMLL